MLKFMARGCMRGGEVLKLTPMDIEDRKAIIRDPKSGREAETVFLPQKLADKRIAMTKRVELNTSAPDFSLADFTGRRVRLSDYRDRRHVFLVFNRGFV
jgi:integrase/recombinase XerD